MTDIKEVTFWHFRLKFLLLNVVNIVEESKIASSNNKP